MLISYSHKFVFVQVPKVAGSSIDQTLMKYTYQPESVLINRVLLRIGVRTNFYNYYKWKLFPRHAPLSRIQRGLPEDVFADFFKFAFVRNPWDRMVSQYFYIKQTPTHHLHKKINRLSNFKEFLKLDLKYMKVTQKDFLTDSNGEIALDFIGRFEDLHSDFSKICAHIGVKEALSHSNKSERMPYQEYYDQASKEFVEERFQSDIKLFGYTFDYSSGDHSYTPITLTAQSHS